MRLLLLAIFSVLLFPLQAQDQEVIDSTAVTPKVRLLVPRLYWDYGKTLMLWNPQVKRTEVGAELLIKDKIQVIGELGTGLYAPEEFYQNIDYTVEGTYYRVGLGYLGRLDATNRIGLGARYAEADFSDGGTIIITSASGFNNDLNEDFERKGLTAQWMEIVLNSEKMVTLNSSNREAKINEMVSLGLMIRYRIMLDEPEITEYEDIEVFAVPGYGRAANRGILAFNLFLKMNF